MLFVVYPYRIHPDGEIDLLKFVVMWKAENEG